MKQANCLNTDWRSSGFVSIEGIQPEMVLNGKVKVKGTGVKVSQRNGNTVVAFQPNRIGEFEAAGIHFLVLPFEKALDAYLIGSTDKQLILSKALVLGNESSISLISEDRTIIEISVYPKIENISVVSGKVDPIKTAIKNLSSWKITLAEVKPNLELIKADDRHYVLRAPDSTYQQSTTCLSVSIIAATGVYV